MDESELIKTGMEVALRPVTEIAENALGLVGGDWLKEVRDRNRHRLRENTRKKLADRGAKDISEPSPTEIKPLLSAAQDESNETLADLWASLTATLMDARAKHFLRREFVEIAKRLDPIDVGVLPLLESGGEMHPTKRAFIATRLGVSEDEILNSFRNLARLELSGPEQIVVYTSQPNLTPLGRQFLRAVRG